MEAGLRQGDSPLLLKMKKKKSNPSEKKACPTFVDGEKERTLNPAPLHPQQSPTYGIKTRFSNCQKQLTSLGKTPGCWNSAPEGH